jgi:hypothetical protein
MAFLLARNNAREWLRRLLVSGLWLWFSAGAFSQMPARVQEMARAQVVLQQQDLRLAPVIVPQESSAPPASLGAALESVASRAAVAFTGRVIRLERTGDVLEVSFAVESPLIGNPGSTYTVREWAGLSPLGQSHYTMGERVAIFLHAPGKSGLSSPVDGQEGIVPILQESAEQQPLLDMRRLGTRVVRAMRQPMEAESTSAIALSDASALVAWASRNSSSTRTAYFEPGRLDPGRLDPARLERAHLEPVHRHLAGVVVRPSPVEIGIVRSDLIFAQPLPPATMRHSDLRLGPVAQ